MGAYEERDIQGPDGTPAWAYDEDGYCVCCGNGHWKHHMPECDLRDYLDSLIEEVYQWRLFMGAKAAEPVYAELASRGISPFAIPDGWGRGS